MTKSFLTSKNQIKISLRMDNPFGRRRHRHHHNSDDDYPPPPPPPNSDPFFPPPDPFNHPPPQPPPSNYSSSYYDNPPPPQPPSVVTHHHHVSYESQNYPPPQRHSSSSSYEVEEESSEPHHHGFRPHVPSFIESHIHTGHAHDHDTGGFDLRSKPSVRVYSKAEERYSLAVRDGRVILARSDPNDLSQHWIKDEKYSVKVKDEEGFPSFSLVNKATGQALKHSVGATKPVQLIPYNPDVLDESVLWTLSRDLGDGYRTIRMMNNIRLNVDAFNGDKNHGGVHDGTTIVLWEWKKGENQRWKIIPYYSNLFYLPGSSES
ncbi:Ricin B-like lectin EULS3-like protein [Drosera capensis]